MKIGSAVVGLSAAAFCIFSLTGCVTTESQGSGQGAGARHRGIVKHQHKGKETPAALTKEEWEKEFGPADSNDNLWDDDSTQMGSTEMGDDMDSSMDGTAPVQDYGTTEVYIVQKGDVLSQIALDFDTTTANLIDMNGLSNPDVLYVGQELRVPAGRGGAKTTTKSSGPVKTGGVYIIQKGDTLSGIALAAGVSVDDLRAANGIQGDMIMAGEELNIPDYGKVPSNTQKVTGTSTKKAEPKPEPQPEPAPAEPAPAEPAPAEDPMSYDTPVVEPEPAAMDIGIVEDKVLYPGETLDDVARQYGVSKAEIMRMNNISDESQVREGQRLRIPIAE
jgi:LysM repeat protein